MKFVGAQHLLCDFNTLPPDSTPFSSRIREIVGKDAGITAIGFDHLKGLSAVERVAFDDCKYIDDECLAKLDLVKDTLHVLELSNCKNITDSGLMEAKKLHKLQKFTAHGLPYVKDTENVASALKSALPACEIDIKP